MSTKRLTRDALLAAVALTIFAVEARFPSIVPIPGVKLGLANIVTVWALFTLGPVDAAAILLVRIILGSVFCGSATTLIYSLSGGVLCFMLSLLMRRFVTERQIWVVSVLGAMAHNAGQLIAATLVMHSFAIWAYAPVLLLSGIVSGTITGIAAQLLYKRLKDTKIVK